MGRAIVSDEMPVVKNNNAILAFSKEKAAVKEEFVLEFAGKQITQEEIKKKVKENWTKVQKNKIKDIKTIKVFLQPENSCAYYTINDEGNDSYKIEL